MTVWALDLETNTQHDRLRLAGMYSNSLDSMFMGDLNELLSMLDEGDTLITHNGSGFDIPFIEDILEIPMRAIMRAKKIKHYDTMLVSKIAHPDIECGHSLAKLCKHYFPYASEYWKQELPEGYGNWLEFYDNAPIPELTTYLEQDLKATLALASALTNYMRETFGEKMRKTIMRQVLPVEDRVAHIVSKQVRKGVKFDADAAMKLVKELNENMEMCERVIEPYMPFRPLPPSKIHNPPVIQFKQDGSVSARLLSYLDKYGAVLEDNKVLYNGSVLDLPLTRPLVTSYKLTLANQKELKEYFLECGWKPTMWNKKRDKDTGRWVTTSPRLTDRETKEPCPNLEKFWAHGGVVSSWLMLRARRNVIASPQGTGWLYSKRSDGTIPSYADTLGANTGRFTHKVIANIPRVTSPYGAQLRSLFGARDWMKWVGWDASSLEACMEAHFTYPFDPAYAKALTSGDSKDGTDVHSRNMRALDLPNRDKAKTFKYAITYGAQPPTLAEQLGVNKHTAKVWFDRFWETNDGLRKYKEQLTAQWKANGRKYIVGLDGRPIMTRSEHSLVNASFQSAGAIVMKYAMILADKRITEYAAKTGTMAYGLIRYHDEEQWECEPSIAHVVGAMGVASIIDAGKALNLNVPLGAEFKTGGNWAETH